MVEKVMGSNLCPFCIISKYTTLKERGMSWTKKGATNYLANLRVLDNDLAFQGLVVCNCYNISAMWPD